MGQANVKGLRARRKRCEPGSALFDDFELASVAGHC
jgi:hypothetical protein